ncbi:MAG: hypothetical protein JWQ18_781 [Conexibacter sp.]|nr:hypothetical protein [Conexibacter sp.]
MINVKAPERRHEAERSRSGAGGVLVVALDCKALAEALPIAHARAAALGARVTVAGTARMPFWWAVAASGWMMVPRPWAEDTRVRAELQLREKVGRITGDAECGVVCRHGRAEAWLGRILCQDRYGTVLVATSRLSGRRSRRLASIAGPDRMFAVLTPLR